MSFGQGQRKYHVLTACMNSAGSPDLILTEVEINFEEFTESVPYQRVADKLLADR